MQPDSFTSPVLPQPSAEDKENEQNAQPGPSDRAGAEALAKCPEQAQQLAQQCTHEAASIRAAVQHLQRLHGAISCDTIPCDSTGIPSQADVRLKATSPPVQT